MSEAEDFVEPVRKLLACIERAVRILMLRMAPALALNP